MNNRLFFSILLFIATCCQKKNPQLRSDGYYVSNQNGNLIVLGFTNESTIEYFKVSSEPNVLNILGQKFNKTEEFEGIYNVQDNKIEIRIKNKRNHYTKTSYDSLNAKPSNMLKYRRKQLNSINTLMSGEIFQNKLEIVNKNEKTLDAKKMTFKFIEKNH